jgi:hypothetical protein
MRCEKSFKQVLIKYWGMTELQQGQSYDVVKVGMKALNRLTLAEIKLLRTVQKGR